MQKKTGIILILSVLLFFKGCKPGLPTAPDDSILNVSANPNSIANNSSTQIRVLGYKATGVPLPDGIVVFFSSDIGSIDSSAEFHKGVAYATFRSDQRSGTANIYVSSGNAKTTPSPLQIIVGSAALKYLTLTAVPAILPKYGGESQITARTFDAGMNPLSSIPVILSTDKGTLSSAGRILYSDQQGRVEDTLYTKETATVTAVSGAVTATTKVTIETNNPPTANFVYSPQNPKVNEIVYFNASASFDNDGTIVSYRWDFGDGSTAQGVTATHRFSGKKTYTVLLIIVDNSGNNASTSKEISVTED